jgi:hypothetical protein
MMTLPPKNVQQELTTKIRHTDVSEVTYDLGRRGTHWRGVRLQAADFVTFGL